jgi:hypothetical protein
MADETLLGKNAGGASSLAKPGFIPYIPAPCPRKPPRPWSVLSALGCAKNTVDSERILGQLVTAGFLVAEDPAQADVCLVNTCGFIHDSREESAGVLKELQQLKASGSLKSVVALGCLVERAQGAPELNAFLDQADAAIGFQDYPRLAELCRESGHRAGAQAGLRRGRRRRGGAGAGQALQRAGRGRAVLHPELQ